MALTLDRFELQVTLFAFDDDGTQVSRKKTYEINAVGADAAAQRLDAASKAAAFLTDLQAVTGAGVGSYRLSEVQEDPAISVPTDNLYKEAVIVFALNETGSKKATHTVPAPAAVLLSSDGRSVDVGSTESQAFFDNFKDAGGIRISDGESVRATNPVVSSSVRSVSSGKSY